MRGVNQTSEEIDFRGAVGIVLSSLPRESRGRELIFLFTRLLEKQRLKLSRALASIIKCDLSLYSLA